MVDSVKEQKKTSPSSFPGIPYYAVQFLMYEKNVNNLSAKTIKEYYLDLHTFFRFVMRYKNLCDSQIEFTKIDASSCPLSTIAELQLSDLYEYLNFVYDERSNNIRARLRKTSSLRTFYKYLTRQALIENNPTVYLEMPQNRNKLPVYLTVEESLQLLDSIDGEFKVRNYAIITLFLNCGLRLSELVGLNVSSIRGNSIKVHGKGNKERILYLNDACEQALADYLKIRSSKDIKSKDKDALFISRNGNRISTRMVQTLVKKYMKAAGIDCSTYSTHKLRHTAATLMYQNGVDVRVLQEVLGHESLSTTQIYTHLASKQIENAITANPLSSVTRKDQAKDETEN